MTHCLDAARGRDVVARWCALAERRLEYLTQLFETGRWRRYHSELAFLENIQEAKSAVEIWRDLSLREASSDNHAIDISWLGRTGATLPRDQKLHDQLRLPPQPAEFAPEPSPPDLPVLADHIDSEEAPSAPEIDGAEELTLGIAAAIAERYPLLRNVL
jgi:uncharacterized repeat protein (TIGR03809 family)